MEPGAKPFQGASCEKRLNEWIKFLELEDFEIINQCDLSTTIELFAIDTLEYYIWKRYKLITLGNNASKKLKKYEHFKLPHPSGLNRQLNNKEFVKQKLQECKNWLNNVTF